MSLISSFVPFRNWVAFNKQNSVKYLQGIVFKLSSNPLEHSDLLILSLLDSTPKLSFHYSTLQYNVKQ